MKTKIKKKSEYEVYFVFKCRSQYIKCHNMCKTLHGYWSFFYKHANVDNLNKIVYIPKLILEGGG